MLSDQHGMEPSRTVVTTDGLPLEVSASIGAVSVDVADEPDITPEQLLRRADVAMHRAKSRGKARHDIVSIGVAELAALRIDRHVWEG